MKVTYTGRDVALSTEQTSKLTTAFEKIGKMLDTGKGEGASVSVFKDKAGADESIHLAADYVKNHLSKLVTQKPEVIEGPVKAHD